MSEEEKRDDVYIRHQPEYRSNEFTAFLNKLDERSSKKQSNHSRYKRTIGTPVKKTPPAGIQKWLTKSSEPSVSSSDNDQEENTSSDDIDEDLV